MLNPEPRRSQQSSDLALRKHMHLEIRDPAVMDHSVTPGPALEPALPSVLPQPLPALSVKQVEPQVVHMQSESPSQR